MFRNKLNLGTKLTALVSAIIMTLVTVATPAQADGKITACSTDPSSPIVATGPLSLFVTVKFTTQNPEKDDWGITFSTSGFSETKHVSDSAKTTQHDFYTPITLPKLGTYKITITDFTSNGARCYMEGAVQIGPIGPTTPKGDNPCKPNCETAIGEIPTNPTAFAGQILTIAIGLAGGIALIIMVWGSIKVLTSGGEPKKMGEGREMIVAAVSGLLFLILSVLILRFIGSTFLPTTPF